MLQARGMALLLVLSLFTTPLLATSDSSVSEDEAKQEQSAAPKDGERHPSCEKLCLEDGEDPYDCEQYCIQVAGGACSLTGAGG